MFKIAKPTLEKLKYHYENNPVKEPFITDDCAKPYHMWQNTTETDVDLELKPPTLVRAPKEKSKIKDEVKRELLASKLNNTEIKDIFKLVIDDKSKEINHDRGGRNTNLVEFSSFQSNVLEE